MNTDSKPDLHKLENSKLLFKDETQQILGCAFEVLNEVGHEKIYENGLVVAFRLKGIPCDQQRRFPVLFREVVVGEFVPDLIDFNLVIVDPKDIDRITDHERGKMGWSDSKLQTRPPGVGAHRAVMHYPCSSVSIRG